MMIARLLWVWELPHHTRALVHHCNSTDHKPVCLCSTVVVLTSMTWIEVVRCRHRASGWTTCHHDSACFLFYYIQNILYIFVSVILSTPAWKLMQPQNVAIRQWYYKYSISMVTCLLWSVSQVRKHELSRSTNVWASFHCTLTSETAATKNTSYRCALSSGSKSRDIMQNQRLQSNYESASFFLPLSTFRIEIMFFLKHSWT